MEQDKLLLKLQINPEYRAFQDERKMDVLSALLFCIFFFWAATFNLIQSVTPIAMILMIIVLVCLVVSIGLVFSVFLKKPAFVIEGVIKDVKQATYRTFSESWYLVLDDTNQRYWGKCVTNYQFSSPSSFFHNSNKSKKSHFVGEKVLCFSFGGERWIVSE